MALRDQEKRQLAEIEHGLAQEDPRFAATLNKLNAKVHPLSALIRATALLLATYLVGLTTIVGGVWLSSAFLVVLGAAVTASMPVLVTWKVWRARHWHG